MNAEDSRQKIGPGYHRIHKSQYLPLKPDMYKEFHVKLSFASVLTYWLWVSSCGKIDETTVNLDQSMF